MTEPLDPRAAALAQRDQGVAIALALVYVGDQIGRLVPIVDAEVVDERGALIDSGYAPVDTTLVGAGFGRARFAIGPRVFEVLIGQSFELFIDASGGVNAREGVQLYKNALEKIAKLDAFGDAPMDDLMRDIAVGALAAGER